jgi:Domain of unknown function (DUF1772)
MKRSIIFASMAIAAGLTLANVYNSIVDAPSWGSNIPTSIDTARQYYKSSNPGNFFRIFSPTNQFLGLLCVVLFWKQGKRVRYFLMAAFVLYVIGEGMTFMYFYPRNEIMFMSGTTDVETLKTTWQQWSSMNWVRSFVVAAGFVCSSLALHNSYLRAAPRTSRHQTSSAGQLTEIGV